jgi:hypothetical protein
MTTPHWADTENFGPWAWDSVWLGDDLLPGVWSARPKKGRDVEKVKVKGEDGITLKDNGSSAPQIVLTGRLWHQQDWELWQEIQPNIDPEKPGAVRTPLPIYTALAELTGIRAVYIESIEFDPPKTAAEVLTVTITCTKWFPATKKTQAKTKDVKGFDGADRTDFDPDDFDVKPSNTVGNQL